MTKDTERTAIVRALTSADWSNVSIGNKAIIQAAIAALAQEAKVVPECHATQTVCGTCNNEVGKCVYSAQEAQAVPDECVASGQSCSYAPEGPNKEMQCRYCGNEQAAPQSVPAQPVAIWAAFDEEGTLLAHSKIRPGLSEILKWEPLYRAAPPAAEQDADTAGAKLVSDQVHLRSLYDMVYAHECTFKAFAADISEITAGASNERADATPLDKPAEQDVPRALTDELRDQAAARWATANTPIREAMAFLDGFDTARAILTAAGAK